MRDRMRDEIEADSQDGKGDQPVKKQVVSPRAPDQRPQKGRDGRTEHVQQGDHSIVDPEIGFSQDIPRDDRADYAHEAITSSEQHDEQEHQFRSRGDAQQYRNGQSHDDEAAHGDGVIGDPVLEEGDDQPAGDLHWSDQRGGKHGRLSGNVSFLEHGKQVLERRAMDDGGERESDAEAKKHGADEPSSHTVRGPRSRDNNLAGFFDVMGGEPRDRSGRQGHHYGEYLHRVPPSQRFGQEIGARKAEGAGKSGNQRDQGDALLCVAALIAGDQGEAGIVQTSGKADSDDGPQEVEPGETVDHRKPEETGRAEQDAKGHHGGALSDIDQFSAYRSAKSLHDDGQGDRSGDIDSGPAEVGLPSDQEGGEDIEEPGP